MAAAILVATTALARAGVCTGDGQPRHEFRLLAGYSPEAATLIGTATDRRFGMVEFSYTYRCWSWNAVSIGYTAGVIPAAFVFQPRQTVIPSHAVYGFAVMPAGFFAEFARRRRVHPVAEANGGILASTEPIPERGNNATGLNFLFNLGGGIRFAAGRGAITVGYRFLHISNAGTTDFNPGLDNNVFYLSWSFLR